MTKADLRPGDVLLYTPKGWLSWGTLICIKTFSTVSHSEIYVGSGMTIAARETAGVSTYTLMEDRLKYIVRPPRQPNMDTMLKWHRSVKGAGYDYWGLLSFYNIGHGDQHRYICSEHTTLACRAGGVEFFRPDVEAQKVCPGMFLTSPVGIVFQWS